MATRKPASTARQRDHSREEQGRATKVPTKMPLTEDERAALDAFVAAMAEEVGHPVPMKKAVLAAVRAGRVLLAGGTVARARGELLTDLQAAKPGPKT